MTDERPKIVIDLNAPVPVPTGPRVWTCGVCGREAPWGPGWAWLTDGVRPNKWSDPEIVLVVCSDECRLRGPYAEVPYAKE